MKRILILILAVGLILGLSATALAAGSINFYEGSTSNNATVTSSTTISFNGGVSGLDFADDKTYTLTVSNNQNSSEQRTFSITSSNSDFGYSTSAGNFSAGASITFTFSVTSDNDQSTAAETTRRVSIEAPKSGENYLTYINIPGVGSKNGPPENGFSFTAPSTVTSIQASSINTTVSDKASAQICNSSGSVTNSISLGAVGNATTTTFIVRVTAENDATRDYTFTVNREAAPAQLSTDTSMSKVEIKSGNTVVDTASGNDRSLSIPNSYDGTLSIVATANSKAKAATPSQSTIKLTTAGQPYNFSVTVVAENGISTETHNYSITRQAPTTTTLATGLTLRTGSLVTSTQVGTALSANITSSNYTTTRSLQIPTSYSSTTSFYVHATTASGVSSTPVQVNIPTSTSSTSVNINIGGYSVPVSITRAAVAATTYINSVTLKSGSASGSTVGTAISAVTSANVSGSRSIIIPASLKNTTTFVAVVALPSGTVNSASITGTGTSSSRNSNNVTLTIPSNTTSATLNLTVPGYSSAIPITITREASNAILKSVTFTYSGSTLATVGAVSGNSTQNVGLNTTATSANVSWVLADGATLASATWNNSNTSSGSSIGLPSGSSTRALVLKINASNGTQYTATFNVSSSGTTSLTNTLSSLYIKSSATNSTNTGYLFRTSPSSFRSSTTAYDVYVEEDVDTIYIYPTPNNSGASVNISGNYKDSTDRYNSNGYFVVDLRSSNNTVRVNVVVNNTTTTYTLNIEREDEVVTNASLDSLIVSKSSTSSTGNNKYTMDPSFAYNRTKYEVNIPKNISEVYLHLETHRSDADLSVSGASRVSDGVYKATLTTNRTKTVTVTVEYKNDETEYTINLNSGSATSHAQLSRIRVAERESNSSTYQYTLLPEFDSSITDYVVLIPYGSSGNYAYVQATLDDDGDELRVDGEDVDSGTWLPVDITRGKKVSVPIRVTDGDDNTTTYDLQIVAAERNASDDADLDELSLRTGSSSSSEITLSPSFSHNTTKYTAANVANSYNTLRVYAEPSDNDAWVIVNDVLMTGSYAEVDLDEGKNTIEVVVYAADCETSETYTISVNRGAAGGSDTTLSGLEARYGTSNVQTLNLIPAFSKSTTTYRINVDGTVAQVAFKATTTDDTATIKIMGKDEVSGQWGSYNALSNGENTFLIVVTSGDGKSSSYYTVSVVRGISVVVSSQKLRVNGADVTCSAYNINGNNYFKLRDIAYALRGTPKHFDVAYNSVTRNISMVSGRDYSPIGGEMVRTVAAGKYQLSNQAVIKDGVFVILTAYNVDGNNYFMLREIGQLFNFGVDYDSSNSTVMIDTSKIYVPGS